MIQKILAIHALSPLHCGSGQGISGIDIPIQRERHTQWPCLPSSSIKGVLRDAFRSKLVDQEQAQSLDQAESHPKTLALFGSEPTGVELGLGALIVGDAFLLLMPVRSMTGVFAWATCPLALTRLQRLLQHAGRPQEAAKLVNVLKLVPEGQVFASAVMNVATQPDRVILEDHSLTRKDLPTDLVGLLSSLLPPQPEEFIANHLALVSDDLFTWFAVHATSIEARIRLDVETKTVKDGALFYEETLPPEAVLMAPLNAEDARHPKADPKLRQAASAIKEVETLVQGCSLQFGGKATIGRGQCALRLN